MLLQELVGVKAQKSKTAYEILDRLKKEHGIQMKSGAFGLVLIHPSWDHVIKFFVKDDCYLKFVNYCLKNPSPHLPDFKRKPTRLSAFFRQADSPYFFQKYYVVKIEKLDPISEQEHRELYPLLFPDFHHAYAEVIGTKQEDAFLEKHKVLKHKELANVIFELYEQKVGGCFMDLHEGNFMKRGDKIVVLDPYATFNTKEDSLPLEYIFGKAEWHDLIDYEEYADTMADAFTVPLSRNTAPL